MTSLPSQQRWRVGPVTPESGQSHTCPECPRADEPIRREVSGDRVRFVAVVTGTPGPGGKRRQHKRRHDTLAEARAWVERTRAGVASAARRSTTFEGPSGLTVRVLADRWLDARRAEVGVPGGVRAVTVNGYASALASPLTLLGDRVATHLTPGDVEAALRHLASEGGVWGRPLSHRTLVYGLGALRQVYSFGLREGWVTANPAAIARAPRAQHSGTRREAQRWLISDLVKFREYADTAAPSEPWVRAGMRLTLAGLRRSEVLGLDWQRTDLDAGTVEITASRVKTGRGTATALGDVKAANSARVVHVEALHPGTAGALRALWLSQGRPDAGLVIRDAAGEPISPDAYSARFRALAHAAGVPPLRSVHNVRHTLATSLAEAGVPSHEAAALLGHDVATYSRFYLVTDDKGAAAAAEAGGRLFAV